MWTKRYWSGRYWSGQYWAEHTFVETAPATVVKVRGRFAAIAAVGRWIGLMRLRGRY